MHCPENLILPLDGMHIGSKVRFTEKTPGYQIMDKTPGARPWDIMAYISEFNGRDLQFPEDALNAMYGIFNSFGNGPIKVQYRLDTDGHMETDFQTKSRRMLPHRASVVSLIPYQTHISFSQLDLGGVGRRFG
jgi:hypothetical protein